MICFENILIFRELYKILALIHNTNLKREFIESPKYKRHIKVHSNVTSQMNIHKNFIYKTYNSIKSNGEHRIN